MKMTPQIDLSQLSTEALEAALKEKKAQENAERNAKRGAYEELRRDTIKQLIPAARAVRDNIITFKLRAFAELNALYEVLCEYSETRKDSEGNLSITSDDEQFKIAFKNQKKGGFDERSKEAEKLIAQFLNEKYEGDADTRDLIFSLLERRNDDLDVNLVQKLYAMETRFTDENWTKGIALLKESWQPLDSKIYINFYERNANNEWKQIKLNFSNV